MTTARLEHVNFTVPDPKKTAGWLCELFGWKIRWEGGSIHNGFTVHVGGEDSYFAIYTGPNHDPKAGVDTSYNQIGGLNHVGIVVDDLDQIEAKVQIDDGGQQEQAGQPQSYQGAKPRPQCLRS